MWNAITLHEMDKVIPVPMPPGNEDITYGGALFEIDDYKYVEEQLRYLICRCLIQDPAKRPTLHQLNFEISARLAKGFPFESDEDTKAWSTNFYNDPVPDTSTFPPKGTPAPEWMDAQPEGHNELRTGMTQVIRDMLLRIGQAEEPDDGDDDSEDDDKVFLQWIDEEWVHPPQEVPDYVMGDAPSPYGE